MDVQVVRRGTERTLVARPLEGERLRETSNWSAVRPNTGGASTRRWIVGSADRHRENASYSHRETWWGQQTLVGWTSYQQAAGTVDPGRKWLLDLRGLLNLPDLWAGHVQHCLPESDTAGLRTRGPPRDPLLRRQLRLKRPEPRETEACGYRVPSRVQSRCCTFLNLLPDSCLR